MYISYKYNYANFKFNPQEINSTDWISPLGDVEDSLHLATGALVQNKDVRFVYHLVVFLFCLP